MRIGACCLLATISCFAGCTSEDDASPQPPDAGAVTVAAPATPVPGDCPLGQIPTKVPAGWICTNPLGQGSLQNIQGTVNALQTAIQNQQAEMQSAEKATQKK